MATITALTGNAPDVQTAINSSSNGDTVIIPNGSYTWSQTVICAKGITLRAATVTPSTKFTGIPAAPPPVVSTPPAVTITHGGASTLLSVTANSGNVSVAGLGFLRGTGAQTQTYMSTAGTGTSGIPIIFDCAFDLGNFTGPTAIFWGAVGGLMYNCHWYSGDDGAGAGWGSGSGCVQLKPSGPNWYNASTFGALDSTGTTNIYVEQCQFDNIYNQALDADDNTRLVVRYCILNNTQCLTHGITSLWGGRQLEFYSNDFNYQSGVIVQGNAHGTTTIDGLTAFTPVQGVPATAGLFVGQKVRGALLQTGTTIAAIPSGSSITLSLPASGTGAGTFGFANTSGFFNLNVNRWIWMRAGTARITGNQVDALLNSDYFGGTHSSWVFIDEPLTRSGTGNGGVCETQANYPGTRWPGTGSDGTLHPTGVIVSPSFVDPVYIWGNVPGGSDGTSLWGTNDQTPPTQNCFNGPTSAVFLQNRDVIFNTTPAGYVPFQYPHPLNLTAGTGGPSVLALVQHGFVSSTVSSGVTAITFSFATPNAAGNTIIVCVGNSGPQSSTIALPTDSVGNVYFLASSQNSATTMSARVFFAPSIAPGSNIVTVNFAPGVAFPDIMVSEWSGLVQSASALESAGVKATGGTTAVATGNYTTTHAGDLLINAIFTSSTVTAGGTGWIQVNITTDGDYSGYQITGVPASFAATGTLSSAAEWTAQLVPFVANTIATNPATVSIHASASAAPLNSRLNIRVPLHLNGAAGIVAKPIKFDEAIVII